MSLLYKNVYYNDDKKLLIDIKTGIPLCCFDIDKYNIKYKEYKKISKENRNKNLAIIAASIWMCAGVALIPNELAVVRAILITLLGIGFFIFCTHNFADSMEKKYLMCSYEDAVDELFKYNFNLNTIHFTLLTIFLPITIILIPIILFLIAVYIFKPYPNIENLIINIPSSLLNENDKDNFLIEAEKEVELILSEQMVKNEKV